MKSRRERREEAKKNGVSFEPKYNGRVITKEEYDKEVLEFKKLRKKFKKSLKSGRNEDQKLISIAEETAKNKEEK